MSHRFVWVDIPAHDLDRAIAFYGAVLGTPVTREGGPGFGFGLLAHSGSDVAGCLYRADDGNAPSPRGPLVYLNVDGRIGAAERAVAAHGGRVLETTKAIGPHGYRAIVLDSEGNRVALHSPTP
jgi:predicted enzyme related to lactoylglutathione lyase